MIRWLLTGLVLFVVVGLAYSALPPEAPDIAAQVGGWVAFAVFGLFALSALRALSAGLWRTKTWQGGGADDVPMRPDGMVNSPEYLAGCARQAQGYVEHAADLRAAALKEAKRALAGRDST